MGLKLVRLAIFPALAMVGMSTLAAQSGSLPMLRLVSATVGPVSIIPGANGISQTVEAYNAGAGTLLLSVSSSVPWITPSVGTPRAYAGRDPRYRRADGKQKRARAGVIRFYGLADPVGAGNDRYRSNGGAHQAEHGQRPGLSRERAHPYHSQSGKNCQTNEFKAHHYTPFLTYSNLTDADQGRERRHFRHARSGRINPSTFYSYSIPKTRQQPFPLHLRLTKPKIKPTRDRCARERKPWTTAGGFCWGIEGLDCVI